MHVIFVKLGSLFMACSVASGGCGGGGAEELADLGPGEFLVAGVVDGLGQELLGLGDEAGQRVQADGEAVIAGGGCGELAGAGQAQGRAGHEASLSTWVSSEANSCRRWSWWRA